MAFRSGWPGSFQLEPLDRYADTERERAGFLVGSAVAERQRRLAAQAANTVTARVGNMQLAPVPIAPQPKGGGGLWNKVKSGVDAITPDALESPAKTGLMGTLSALDAGRKYVGAPIGGVLSGRLGAEQQTAADGSTFRETGALWEGGEAANLGRGLKKLFTQDPRDTYKESQQAWEEGQRDPAMSAGKRVAGDVAIDPLTWATPGAVGAGLKLLPAGMQASKPARFAGNILSSPTRASVGGLVGSSLAAEGASRTGIPELPATLVGGLAGGIGAGARGLARSATPPPVLNRQQLAIQDIKGESAARRKAAQAFHIEPPPIDEPVTPYRAGVDMDEARSRVKRFITTDWEKHGPKEERFQVNHAQYGPLTFGRGKTGQDWVSEVERIMTDEEIEEAARWYSSSRKPYTNTWPGQEGEHIANAHFASQVNNGLGGGLLNVLRARDVVRGKPKVGYNFAGSSGVNEASIIDALKGLASLHGKSQKILDYIDSSYGKSTRTFMGDDPRALGPFAGDVWQLRDDGFIDGKAWRWLRENTDIGNRRIKADSTGKSGPTESQYNYNTVWGNKLTDHLNEIGWRGKTDWKSGDVQAIGWMKTRKLFGESRGGTMEDAFMENTRLANMSVAPGPGSHVDVAYGERFRSLAPEKQAAVNDEAVTWLSAEIEKVTNAKVTKLAERRGFWQDGSEPAFQLGILASPEESRDIADVLAHVMGQDLVFADRPLFSGNTPAVFIEFAPGTTDDQVGAFYTALRGKSGVSGMGPTSNPDTYHIVDTDGKWGRPKTKKLTKSIGQMSQWADEAAKEVGLPPPSVTDYTVDLYAPTNTWKEGAGTDAIQRLSARGSLDLQAAADGNLREGYLARFGEAIDRAEATGASAPAPAAAAPTPGVGREATPPVQGYVSDDQVRAAWETDVRAANPGVEPADLDQYISGATPDDWSHMRPSLEKAERAQGLAKTPYRENINRIEPDASNIARGRGPLINRLQTERGRGLDPAAIDAAQWFVRNLPEKYTARLASSFVKGTGYEAQAGQYIAKNADEEDGLIRIIKAVTNKQPDPERVIVHEVGHHLEQFVPDEDYRALRSQWEREMGTNHGIMPGSGQGGQKIVDAVDDMVARQPAGKPFDPDAVAGGGGEAYRYTGGFGEWFAENIADRALRDFDQAAEAAGPWQRAWQAIRDIAEGVYRYLLQRGEKDAAERVYRNIMQGKYGESFRTGERTIPQSQGYNTAAPPAGLPLAGVSAVSPPAGGPTSPPAGGKSPRPRIDMFDVIGRKSRLREEDAFNRSLRGKADRGIRTLAAQAGGEKLDKNLKGSDAKTFIVKEKNRIDTQISSYEAKADDLFMGLKNAGLEVEADAKGTLRTPNGTAFEDLLERRTRASQAEFAALPKEQQDAIRALDEWNERLNANLRFHKNSDLGWDESGKLYFPRVSVGVDGKKRAFIENGGGRAMGRTQGFSKERTFEDVFEDGLQAGIDYGDPRNAWRIMTRAKLRAAEDAALANRLKPMGVTKKNIPNGERIGVDWIAVGRDVAPALSGRYFPPDVVQTITSALVPQNSFHAKVITEFNKKATPLRAMADLSFLLQQGSAMIFHPRHAVKVPKATIDVIRSTKDRAVYDRMIKDVGMDLDEAIKHGLVWGADDIAANDFHLGKLDTIGGRIASKPGVKQAAGAFNKVADFSNQTYGRYMNYVRANFVKDAQERLAKMKPGMAPDEWRKEYQGAMNAINRLSGTTGRKVSSIESMGLFAPRYFSASVEQLNAAVTRGGLEGSIARAHLGRMLAFGAAMVIGSNELRGKETELDPRSSNFLRFRDVGGLDVSPFGTYDTLFRAIAGTAAGDPGKPIKPDYMKLWKLAEGKMSPGFKLVYEPFVRKGTYSGEPLDPTTPGGLVNIAKQQGLGSLPFSVQNAVTSGIQPAIEERSLEPLKDAIPGILASGGGATNSPVTPTEKRNLRTEKLAQEKYGKSFEELSGTEKSIINEDAEVKKHQAEADRNIDTLEDDRSINRRASIEREAEIEALTRRLDNKEIPGSEFRKNYRDIQMQARGAREVLEQRKGDKEIEAYFKVFDDAEREDGSTDYEKLDELLPAFVATHPGIEDKVNRIIGTKDNATMREFRVAQSQAREFYALPQYEGLSVEDGKKAAPILAFARRLVANNQAPGYREAIGMMLRNGDISKEDGLLALRAQKFGTSRARKQFKADHAEYRKFYSDEVLDEDYAAANTYGDEPAKLKTGSGGFSLSVTGGKKRSLSLAPIG